MFPESKKRVKAISVSNIVGSIGTILPSVLFFTIAGLWGNQTVEQEKTGYFMAALIFSVMAGIFIASSYFGIKEKVYVKPEKTNYIKGLKIVFSDKKMVILVVVAFFFRNCESWRYFPALLRKMELHRRVADGSNHRLFKQLDLQADPCGGEHQPYKRRVAYSAASDRQRHFLHAVDGDHSAAAQEDEQKKHCGSGCLCSARWPIS